jgi:hypothetical protein
MQVMRGIECEVTEIPDEGSNALSAYWVRHDDEWQDVLQHRARFGAPTALTWAGRSAAVDPFDAHAEHLVFRTMATRSKPSRVVGSCRVLTPAGARAVGGLSMEVDFDLVRLRAYRSRMAEVSRFCLDADWRAPLTVELLCRVLKPFLQANGLDRVVGLAPSLLRDGGREMAERWSRLRQDHLASADLQVRPRLPLPLTSPAPSLRWAPREGLVHAVLRQGGLLLGPPGLSAGRGTAALPLMWRVADFLERQERQELARTSSMVVTPASTFSMPS